MGIYQGFSLQKLLFFYGGKHIEVNEYRPFPVFGTLFMRHTYNGLLALDKGDIQLAKRELLISGKSPKAGRISTMGPNMSLAKRLLETGEQETVLLFLKYCKGFWFFPFRLFFSRKWTGDILAGKISKFEAHVIFFMERPASADNDGT